MLGRVTGIVCLAAAAFIPAGIATQAHAQSMDMMSVLTMSNRIISPVNQYQPVSYTPDDTAKDAETKNATRAAAPSDRAGTKAKAKARHADASVRPVNYSDPD